MDLELKKIKVLILNRMECVPTLVYMLCIKLVLTWLLKVCYKYTSNITIYRREKSTSLFHVFGLGYTLVIMFVVITFIIYLYHVVNGIYLNIQSTNMKSV